MTEHKLARAILKIAHNNAKSDGTIYPVVTIHALAMGIKKLLPDFKYHD